MPVDDNGAPDSPSEFVPNEELLEQLTALAQQDPGPPSVVEEDDFPSSMDFTGAGEPADDPQVDPQPVEDDLPPEFPEEWRDDFIGLLHLGYLQDGFDWLGHRFVIKTLSANDLMEVGLLVKKYQGTIGESRAYSTAMVAACLITVDGKELPQPISMADEAPLQPKFDVVRDYFPVTLDRIYERLMGLEGRVQQIVRAMGERTG